MEKFPKTAFFYFSVKEFDSIKKENKELSRLLFIKLIIKFVNIILILKLSRSWLSY